MVDLHTHTLLSDGILLPAELARRAEINGYKFIGITDHVDFSNIETVISSLLKVAEETNKRNGIKIIPGVEITHVHPDSIPFLVKKARLLGAKLVLVHGETIVEPVKTGTNLAALRAGVDILAHPGILGEEEAALAAEKKIHVEITARKGHSLSNGHVSKLWQKFGFPLVLNTDTHSPDNLITEKFALKVLIASGIKEEKAKMIISQSGELANSLL